MNLLYKITLYKKEFLLIFFFIVLHSTFFNINAAEWGDSYRILRAAEYIRDGSYPVDEKRPPLLSALIALRPENVDQVFFGRLVLIISSFLSLVVFYKFVKKFIADENIQLWTLIVFALNNVYFYWSLRIMADVPFSFLVLLAFWYFIKINEKPTVFNKIILGVTVGLAILTRFEGYLLLGSLGLGLFFDRKEKKYVYSESFLQNCKLGFRKIFTAIKSFYPILIGTLLILLPYWLYRNPLDSTYFEEPAGRVYDLKMLFTYLVSYVYVLGILIYPYFIVVGFASVKNFLVKNLPVAIFVILESLLILAWPAAIPRLFVPIIPFLTLVTGIGLESYFNSSKRMATSMQPFSSKISKWHWLFIANLLIWYVLGQYFLRLQFLILSKPVFVVNMVLQLLILLSVCFRKIHLLLFFTTLTLLIWAMSSVILHRNLLKSVKMAAEYAAQHFEGNVGYNDVSSVSDWYLNYSTSKANLKGFYYNTEKKQNLELEALKTAKIDYLIITNEHNTTMTLDLAKRPYLEQMAIFQYNVNGQVFNSRVVKVR